MSFLFSCFPDMYSSCCEGFSENSLSFFLGVNLANTYPILLVLHLYTNMQFLGVWYAHFHLHSTRHFIHAGEYLQVHQLSEFECVYNNPDRALSMLESQICKDDPSWAVTFFDIACTRKPHSSDVTSLPKYTTPKALKKLSGLCCCLTPGLSCLALW